MYKRIALFLIVAPVLCFYSVPVIGQDSSVPMGAIDEEGFRLISKFYDRDPSIPLEARIVENKEQDGTRREKIVFRGSRGCLVPGYLEFPKTGTAPYPCVLLLHGWSGSKMSWWQDDNYISGGNVRKALLEAGYAIVALDAPTHGDRIVENDYALVNAYTGPGNDGRKNYFTVSEIVIQSTVDYRRGIDYLETRDDIDNKRLGVLGYSMGGLQSILLPAVESRIQVSVGCVVPSWAQSHEQIAVNHYARGLAGRPHLMLMGRTDPLCSVEDAKRIHELIPGEKKDLIFYDSDHKLTSDYVPDAIEWFRKYL